ncbi:MAG: saccharopine dehydrogenase C-terminal domain-containing protein [Salinivirgaceae bacterium]
MNQILILGSGMVAGPIIEYLLEKAFLVTVASIDKERALKLLNNHPNGRFIHWDAADEQKLDELVKDHDLAVSLLPFKFHTMVAKICLKHKKHMVTTSYVKPEMQALHTEAQEKGILLLNEIGVDPGIDHMSAMRIIDKVHSEGGEIEEFYSITGALPDPKCVDNPLGYKFSWSPKGVVMASKNDATYLKNGEKIHVTPKNLFRDIFELDFPQVGKLDVYPNRNSVDYVDIYGIPEVQTIFRGTFRLKGWCETLDAIKQLGLIDDEKRDFTGLTYAQFTQKVAGIGDADLASQIAKKLDIETTSTAIKAMEWLGLFENKPMNLETESPFDITSDLMIEKMWMDPSDRDIIAMQHIFQVKSKDRKRSVIKSSLLDYGDPEKFTSVARTVALPAAVAVEQILKGNIKLTGTYRPVVKEIYEPVMDALEKMDIKMNEEFDLPIEEGIKK